MKMMKIDTDQLFDFSSFISELIDFEKRNEIKKNPYRRLIIYSHLIFKVHLFNFHFFPHFIFSSPSINHPLTIKRLIVFKLFKQTKSQLLNFEIKLKALLLKSKTMLI